MSYILDALKKAESERKLGSIPNIYAQPVPSATANADAPDWRKWLPWLSALLMFAIMVGGIAWLQPWRSQSARVTPASPPTAQTAANPVPLAPSPTNEPALPSVSHAPLGAGVPKTNPVIALHATKNIGSQHAKPPKLADAAQPAAEPVLPATVPKVASVTRSPASEAGQAEGKPVGTLQDLPENIQRELPAIVINGYIYARNPADRSVLINKRLLHEGDQVGPELVLEKMTPSGAVLNYKGYRYRIAY